MKKHSISVLLVDDQIMIGEAVKRLLASESDIDFHFCSDPTKAIETALKVKPTVILQDLVMPNIDGLTLVKTFREEPQTKETPLIVLSTKEDPKIKAEAFSLGANDYMVKLPDKLEIIARIRYHSKGYIAQLERNAAYDALQTQLDVAADYVKALLPEPLTGEVEASSQFIPSDDLGGDGFGYYWLNDEHFVMYLLDVCDHGVGAALLSVSALNALRSQTLPDVDFTDPASVLSGLNKAFPEEQHRGNYFTMWYGVFNKKTQTLTYASGGHPPSILFQKNPEEKSLLETPSIAIGVMQGSEFSAKSIKIEKPSRLYIFSDGAYEVESAKGKNMMTLEEFSDELSKESSGNKLESMLKYTRTFQGKEEFDDDFSLLEIKFK